MQNIIPIIFPIYCDHEFSFQFCDIKNLAIFFLEKLVKFILEKNNPQKNPN